MRDMATAVIYYRPTYDSNIIVRWPIGCSATRDNQETIRTHLKRHRPQSEFIGCEIIPDKPKRGTS